MMKSNKKKETEKKKKVKITATSLEEFKNKTRGITSFIKDIVDIIKGRDPLSGYLKPVLNPENPQTSSNLTLGQTNYCENAHWIADIYPEFKCMRESAKEIELTRLSYEGFGIKESVKLVQALSKSKETEKTSVIEKIKDKVKTQ